MLKSLGGDYRAHIFFLILPSHFMNFKDKVIKQFNLIQIFLRREL